MRKHHSLWSRLLAFILIVLGLAACRSSKPSNVINSVGHEEDLYGGPDPAYYEQVDSIAE